VSGDEDDDGGAWIGSIDASFGAGLPMVAK